jgi:hypothetical protein
MIGEDDDSAIEVSHLDVAALAMSFDESEPSERRCDLPT